MKTEITLFVTNLNLMSAYKLNALKLRASLFLLLISGNNTIITDADAKNLHIENGLSETLHSDHVPGISYASHTRLKLWIDQTFMF